MKVLWRLCVIWEEWQQLIFIVRLIGGDFSLILAGPLFGTTFKAYNDKCLGMCGLCLGPIELRWVKGYRGWIWEAQ